MPATAHLLPEHVVAFQETAKLYNVAILVRRTNTESLKHIGQPYAVAKRLDCKPKTADKNYTLTGHGEKAVAGLVVDPTRTGIAAFNTKDKFGEARDEWIKFENTKLAPELATLEGLRSLTYIPGGGVYYVEIDPKSRRYGCVKFSSSSLISAGKYIHGDFDLYAIVSMEEPGSNIRAVDTRLGVTHTRSPFFFDVQHALNRKLGVPAVLHGEDDTYRKDHRDEGLDVFLPSGEFLQVENQAQIDTLYRVRFNGRRLFKRDAVEEVKDLYLEA